MKKHMVEEPSAHDNSGKWLNIADRSPLCPFEGIELWSVHSEELMLSLVRLAPGAVVPPHHHANQQAGSVVAGSLAFTIGADTKQVVAGIGYLIPPHVEHSAIAGPDGALVVEVFAPPRDAYRM